MATITRGEQQDIHYSFYESKEQIVTQAVKAYLKAVELVGISEVIMIVPMKKNEGVTATTLNNIIQEKYIKKKEPFVKSGDTVFYVGSKVIQTVNDYKGKNVINGEMGYIKDILTDRIIVSYPDADVEYTYDDVKELDLAYCITGHKYQGSQAKIIIVVIDISHYVLLSKQWLYTALTRGIEMDYIIANPKAFSMAISIDHSKRKTFMQKIIKGVI